MRQLITLALVMLALASMITACSKNEPAIDAIRKRGVLTVGVREDVKNFSKLNASTGEYEGLEVELAKLIANDIFGDPSKVEFKVVTSKTRGTTLDNGDVDIVIATFTINAERKEQWNFSTSYYTDNIGFLVRTDSGIKSIEDINGKIIGVVATATTKNVLQQLLDEKGMIAVFSEFTSYPEIRSALVNGSVDVFSVDRSILRSYQDKDTMLLADKFSPQDYGIATKLSNTELAEYIDKLVSKWKTDGTLDGLISQFELDQQS